MLSLILKVLPVKKLAVKAVGKIINKASPTMRNSLRNVLLQSVDLIEVEAKKTPNKFDDIAVLILKELIK
tara:strand:- start:80 stop:289 length:210 start_codon:yes stop_codon:yes gene_type:complete